MRTLVFKEFYSPGDTEPFDVRRCEVFLTEELESAIEAARSLLARNERIAFVEILLRADEYLLKETYNLPPERRYILNLPEYLYLSVHRDSIILKLYNDYSFAESEPDQSEQL